MGGDYEYLTRAFGPWAGFLFGWAQLTAVLTGSIGAMAYAFGDYAVTLFDWKADRSVWLAVASVVVLTLLNLAGVIFGKAAQNVLTAIKILGLTGIVVAGFAWGGDSSWVSAKPMSGAGFGLAMVFVLYAYGGWNDAAFVAAEVRRAIATCPALMLWDRRDHVDLPADQFGFSLGSGIRGCSPVVGTRGGPRQAGFWAVGLQGDQRAGHGLGVGAINGLIFTGSRIYVSLGADHRVFGWLGRWNARRGTPVRSLLAQSAIALLLIVAVGTKRPAQLGGHVMGAIGLGGLPWGKYFGGFDTLVAATAPVFWMFFLLTGYSLLLLRAKDRDIQRPFSAPFYPLEPILFCGMCHFMLFSAIDYAGGLSLLGLVPLALGVPLYLLEPSRCPIERLTLRTSTSEASASDHVGRPFRAVQGRPGRADLQPAAKLDSKMMTFSRQRRKD